MGYWRIIRASQVQFLLSLVCHLLLRLDFASKLLGLSEGFDGQFVVKYAAL
jgi:hypothetical protein